MSKKNIRLSFDAWKELRNLKFDTGKGSYSDIFMMMFNAIEKGETSIQDTIISKKPSDEPNSEDVTKSDKTIVIDEDIHERLASYKTLYMREHDATARGPGAVSISMIVKLLIAKYREIAE